MPINPAVIQEIPGREYDISPSPAEGAMMGIAAGMKGYANYLAEKEKRKQNLTMQIMPTMISEGLLSPVAPDTPGSIEAAGTSWAFSSGATGYKQKERETTAEKSRIAIKKGRMAVGERPKSRSQLYTDVREGAAYRRMVEMSAIKGGKDERFDPTKFLITETDRLDRVQRYDYLRSKREVIRALLKEKGKAGTDKEVNDIINEYVDKYSTEQIVAALGE